MAEKIRDKIAPAVREMRKQGLSWTEIGRTLGVTSTTAKTAVDPAYLAKRQQKVNNNRRVSRAKAGQTRVRKEEAIAAVEFIRDTRGFTARMMGDPLPGRSALDQRSSA